MTKKKKLFRKVTALAAVIALGASLAGCGSSDGETTQRYSWPLATASPEDTVTQIFAEKFAEEISELSDGRMKIQVYANSTLGGDRDLLETCADGDIPFVVQNTAPQVSFMAYFPMFVDMTERECLIVGGGNVAYRKVIVMLDFGAKVTVVAEDICDELRKDLRNG